MPTRSSKPKKPPRQDRADVNVLAARAVAQLTGQTERAEPPKDERNPHAVALGKLGGAKGGKARAAKLSARRRREIARKAAQSRWAK